MLYGTQTVDGPSSWNQVFWKFKANSFHSRHSPYSKRYGSIKSLMRTSLMQLSTNVIIWAVDFLSTLHLKHEFKTKKMRWQIWKTTCKTSPTCATPSVHKLLLYIRCWLQFHRLSSSPQVVEPSAAFSWPRFGGMASFAIATLFLQLQAKNHHACSRPKLVCQLLHVQPRPTCHQDLWNLQMDHASACHRSRRHQEQVGKHCRTWNTCRECNTKLGQGTRVDGVITIRCIAILFAIDVHSLKQTCACMCQKKGMAMVWHACKNM